MIFLAVSAELLDDRIKIGESVFTTPGDVMRDYPLLAPHIERLCKAPPGPDYDDEIELKRDPSICRGTIYAIDLARLDRDQHPQ